MQLQLSCHRVDDKIYHGWANGSLWSSKTSHVTQQSVVFHKFVGELCKDRSVLELVLEYTRPDYEFFRFPPSKLCGGYEGRL